MTPQEVDKLVTIVRTIPYEYCSCLEELLDNLAEKFPDHDWRDLCFSNCEDCGKKLTSVRERLCPDCYYKRFPPQPYRGNAMTLQKMDAIFKDVFDETCRETINSPNPLEGMLRRR